MLEGLAAHRIFAWFGRSRMSYYDIRITVDGRTAVLPSDTDRIVFINNVHNVWEDDGSPLTPDDMTALLECYGRDLLKDISERDIRPSVCFVDGEGMNYGNSVLFSKDGRPHIRREGGLLRAEDDIDVRETLNYNNGREKMKITVINGTQKHGVTYRLKEIFLEPFRNSAEITEFYLPKDCPDFCCGCTTCFLGDQHKCKDAEYVQKIEKAMFEADLLVFTSPAYVYHATGAMKAMLDHFGYRWMPHRPAKEMFGKRAVIITQCLGGGAGSTAKDIRDSLSWWGISYIKTISFKLMSEIHWEKIPEEKRAKMSAKLGKLSSRMLSVDYSVRPHTSIVVKGKFMVCRMLQKGLGKKNPEYTDFNYWKDMGWTEGVRPWKD